MDANEENVHWKEYKLSNHKDWKGVKGGLQWLEGCIPEKRPH